ncbi:sodium-dependent transporter [bacterium]|nr:sodium-dependent transporter [bacterium]
MVEEKKKRGHWKSKLGFILAAAGSAVGLGNIWKFPYITGENGGGYFVLIYLACILIVGIPIMMAEIMIGRASKKQPVGAFEELQGEKTGWTFVGWMGVACGFIILSFYIVVAGWAMDYTLKAVVNFSNPIAEKAETAAKVYRVKTSVADMRKTLVERRIKLESAESISVVRGKASKKVWSEYKNYTKAIESGVALKEARKVLFEDEKFKRKIELAIKLEKNISEIKRKARVEAIEFYEKIDDKKIRDESETLFRRQKIAVGIDKAFGSLVTDGWTSSFWAFAFMLLTILVVAGGVSGGIEKVCTVLMPTLVGIMIFMVCYGVFQPGFKSAITFVFYPDISKLKASGVLEALGHAFFTLSLGMGAMLTYGSYQEDKKGLLSQSIWIALLDTGIAILACMMIFPIIFSYGMSPSAGPGLVFKSMPLAFTEIGSGGMLLGIIFFSLLVLAALTSAISLLEVVASYFIDVKNWSRVRAAWIIGGAVFLFALPSAFSYDPDFIMASWTPTFGMNFFDTMDYLSSNWLLPFGGLFIAIYAGWVMPAKLRDAEFEGSSKMVLTIWLMLIRFVAPILVTLVILQKVGILQLN